MADFFFPRSELQMTAYGPTKWNEGMINEYWISKGVEQVDHGLISNNIRGTPKEM